MMRFARLSATALGASAVVVLAASLEAQSAPLQRTVSRMELEYADPFTCVQYGQIRELSDGRLIVADYSEKRLEVIDLRRGTATKIGRQGAGPGEWGLPMSLIPLSGDTTLVYDPQNNRMLKILPNGSVAEDPISLSSGQGGMMMILRPRGFDRAGRLYFQGSSVRMTPGGGPTEPLDSVAVTRLDTRTSRVDTVGYVKVPRPEVRTTQQPGAGGRGNSTMIMVGGGNPFAPQPTWTALPDGRVAIITPEPYQVQFIGAGRGRTMGPVTAYEKVRVTERDKATSPRAGGPSCSFSISRNDGGGRSEAVVGAVRAAVGGGGRGGAPPPRDDWPEFKPPFLGGGAASTAVATPSGEIWVQRARPVGETAPLYDVFDSRGQLTSRVLLPEGARLLGFGTGSIYVSRMDDDDLVYIQRWRMDSP